HWLFYPPYAWFLIVYAVFVHWEVTFLPLRVHPEIGSWDRYYIQKGHLIFSLTYVMILVLAAIQWLLNSNRDYALDVSIRPRSHSLLRLLHSFQSYLN